MIDFFEVHNFRRADILNTHPSTETPSYANAKWPKLLKGPTANIFISNRLFMGTSSASYCTS